MKKGSVADIDDVLGEIAHYAQSQGLTPCALRNTFSAGMVAKQMQAMYDVQTEAWQVKAHEDYLTKFPEGYSVSVGEVVPHGYLPPPTVEEAIASVREYIRTNALTGADVKNLFQAGLVVCGVGASFEENLSQKGARVVVRNASGHSIAVDRSDGGDLIVAAGRPNS